MRYKKPEGGPSGAIKRLRHEEGWNYDKRKDSLTKNKIEHGSSIRWATEPALKAVRA